MNRFTPYNTADRARLLQIPILLLAVGCACPTRPAVPPTPPSPQSTPAQTGGDPMIRTTPPITGSYIMLYYKELTEPARFYGDMLGLEETFADSWFKMFRLHGEAHVGLIREGPGARFPAREQNSVMVSIVTDDLDAWYAQLSQNEEILFLRHLTESETAPIRSFLLADPGGYAVEIFEWKR